MAAVVIITNITLYKFSRSWKASIPPISAKSATSAALCPPMYFCVAVYKVLIINISLDLKWWVPVKDIRM